MISVEEALARCFALVTPLGSETVPLRQAAGRVMTASATARRDQPPFAASAMDGYAVSGHATPGARFEVVGEAGAGHGFAVSVGAGQAVRIFTGAPVPAGAAQVILQEDVTRDGAFITVGANPDAGTNIRPQGQDFRIGASLSPRLLRPNDLALLAAMNIAEVPVARRPRVAIIATGDELVMPGENPGPDQIIASNGFALAALVEAAGGVARLLPIAPDRVAELTTVLGLAADADLILTIGGASVGDHDLVGQVTADMGMERAFWRIAMRPGKPLMAGLLRGVPLIGLPGNPVSAVVCAHLFVLPMLRAMLGLGAAAPARQRATLGVDLPANGARAHYMRARTVLSGTDLSGTGLSGPGLSGTGPMITPFERQDSALLTILTEADALLIRPVGDGARRAGEVVDFLPL